MTDNSEFDRDEIISVLNDLTETCKDGQQGFRNAADSVSDSQLKERFEMFSRQRGRFASELQDEVRKRSGDPQTSGHIAAALHRGWISLKSAVTGRDAREIIAECERGDDAARRNYEEALKKNLPAEVRNLIGTQYDSIKHAVDELRGIELTRKAG